MLGHKSVKWCFGDSWVTSVRWTLVFDLCFLLQFETTVSHIFDALLLFLPLSPPIPLSVPSASIWYALKNIRFSPHNLPIYLMVLNSFFKAML